MSSTANDDDGSQEVVYKMDVTDFIEAVGLDDVLVQALQYKPRKES